MFLLQKKSFYIFFILLLLGFGFWKWLNRSPVPLKIEGETMGTTYHITYFDRHHRWFGREIDSVLLQVNRAINNYDPTSDVSRFNGSSGIRFRNDHFFPILQVSHRVFNASQGAFDPTILPLVNLWGFGSEEKGLPDTDQVDSLLDLVDFTTVSFNEDSAWKKNSRAKLDFGGIGQGYGADAVTDFLKKKGIQNMLVELGGEGCVVGKNLATKKPWKIAILHPIQHIDSPKYIAYASLMDQAFTTSGNYFNYRLIEGRHYGHTISPITGYPVQNTLLSVSVFLPRATEADAWATALMTAGYQKAMEWTIKNPNLQVLLIYTNTMGDMQTYVSPALRSQIEWNW